MAAHTQMCLAAEECLSGQEVQSADLFDKVLVLDRRIGELFSKLQQQRVVQRFYGPHLSAVSNKKNGNNKAEQTRHYGNRRGKAPRGLVALEPPLLIFTHWHSLPPPDNRQNSVHN